MTWGDTTHFLCSSYQKQELKNLSDKVHRDSNLAPLGVVLHAVDGQRDHLHSPFLELPGDARRTRELRGAHGSEVPRVGEKDTPPSK